MRQTDALTVKNRNVWKDVYKRQDIYLSAELNMVNAEMRLIFSMELDPAEDDILVNETPETRQALYSDTMKFFENLYGESSVSAETTQEEVME